jgi:hypothetical protein
MERDDAGAVMATEEEMNRAENATKIALAPIIRAMGVPSIVNKTLNF